MKHNLFDPVARNNIHFWDGNQHQKTFVNKFMAAVVCRLEVASYTRDTSRPTIETTRRPTTDELANISAEDVGVVELIVDVVAVVVVDISDVSLFDCDGATPIITITTIANMS
jgi:hypothetical protein